MTSRRLSPICLAVLIALAALLPAGAPAAGGPARAWLTTGDRANLLAIDQEPVRRTYQRVGLLLRTTATAMTRLLSARAAPAPLGA